MPTSPTAWRVADAKTGKLRMLAAELDRAVSAPKFSADGKAIQFTVEDDGQQYPASVALASGAVSRLGGPMVAHELAAAAGHTAVLVSSDKAPPEVFALENQHLRALTHHNEALFAELTLGAVEDIAFKDKSGIEVHGQIVKPPGYVAGQRYPTILWIHGGPNGQDDHSLELWGYGPPLERQYFATHGYVVLAINYRGGTGRGAAYARAILADWGDKEVEDLLAGVDYAIAQGIADPQRLGVGGWSYGGILTDYVIASDARFKAAISGAGSANQLSMYGADEYVVQYNAELGPPWIDPQLWIKVSYPFFHADRIHTPTLFMGGDKDFNVPIAGGEQMYQALKTLGVPAQLVVYPGEFHVFTRPSFLIDRCQRYLEWMDRYPQGEELGVRGGILRGAQRPVRIAEHPGAVAVLGQGGEIAAHRRVVVGAVGEHLGEGGGDDGVIGRQRVDAQVVPEAQVDVLERLGERLDALGGLDAVGKLQCALRGHEELRRRREMLRPGARSAQGDILRHLEREHAHVADHLDAFLLGERRGCERVRAGVAAAQHQRAQQDGPNWSRTRRLPLVAQLAQLHEYGLRGRALADVRELLAQPRDDVRTLQPQEGVDALLLGECRDRHGGRLVAARRGEGGDGSWLDGSRSSVNSRLRAMYSCPGYTRVPSGRRTSCAAKVS